MLASRVAVSRVTDVNSSFVLAASLAVREAAIIGGWASALERLVVRLVNPTRFKVAFVGLPARQVADLVAACGGQAARFFFGPKQGVVSVIVEGVRQREFEQRLRCLNPLASFHMVRLGRA